MLAGVANNNSAPNAPPTRLITNSARKPKPGKPVKSGQSKTGNMNIYVDALGTVTPTYTVTVYSQITGRVMAVHYHEGQMVQKGDPLIDIDPRPTRRR
jgi:multidrug efflux pump subunit AcrA (membrane-fusion protein)